MSYTGVANSHVTSLDYGQYAGKACSRAILNKIRQPESFIHTIKSHYICSRLKKATQVTIYLKSKPYKHHT